MFGLTSVLRRSLPTVNPFRAHVTPLASLMLKQQQLTGAFSALRTLKTRTSVKKFCKDCYMVRRKGRVYVYCKSNGKHKQRQG
ncbi:hypothetical protein RJF_0835 [Candidozyma auris]